MFVQLALDPQSRPIASFSYRGPRHSIKRFENDAWVDLTPSLAGLDPAIASNVQWKVGSDGDHLIASGENPTAGYSRIFLSADAGLTWHDHAIPTHHMTNFDFGPDGRPYLLVDGSVFRGLAPDQW